MSRSVGRAVGAVVGAVAAVVLGPAGWAAWALAAGGALAGAAYGDYVARQSARIGDQGREPSSRTIRSSKEPAHYLLGRFANGGVLTWVEQDEGDPWTHLILALSEGPIEAVDGVLLDKKPISEFEGNVAQYELTVTPTEANAFMRNNADDWDEDVIGKGLSFIRVSLQFDPEQFPNGLPEIQVIGRGRNDIWDPRTDERGYTDNPALILLWWLTDGRANVPLDEINLQSFIDAANVCDEIVENPDGTQSKRYTMGALISDAELTPDVNDKILATCNGQLIRIGGILSLQVGAYYGPGDITLTEDMVIGAVSGATEVDNANAINTLTGTFTNPDDWTETDFPPVRIDEWVLEDGAELAESMQIRYVLDPYQAQRLANMHLRKRRNGGAMSIPMNFNGYRFRPGRVVNVDLPGINMTGEFIVVDWTLGAADGCVVHLEAYDAAMFDDDVGRPYTPPGFISMPTGGIETPTNLAFLPSDDPMVKQGTVTWTPPPQVVQYYGITIRRDGEAVQTYQVPWSATSCDIQGLGPGQYVIEIYARGELGRSGTASIPINLTVPESPVDLRLEVSNNVIVCRPLVNSPGFGTEFEMCINYLNDPDFIPFDQLTGLYGTFPGLTPDTEYPIYARTISPLGKSEWFSQIARTTNNPAELDYLLDKSLPFIDLRDRIDEEFERTDERIGGIETDVKVERFRRDETDAALIESIADSAAYRDELARRIARGEKIINAEFVVDPETGQIRARAYEYTDDKFSQADLMIDGVQAQVRAAVQRITYGEESIEDLQSEFELLPGLIDLRATAIFADGIAALQPAHSFNFFDSAQGWVEVNGTLTPNHNKIVVTHGDIENTGVEYDGAENPAIRIALTRLTGEGWAGDVIVTFDDDTQYTFEGVIDEITTTDVATIRNLDFRGSEQYQRQITGVRLVLGASAADEFEITAIVIGKPDAALLELEGVIAQVTEAGIRIDALDAEIEQRVTRTEYDTTAVKRTDFSQILNADEGYAEIRGVTQQIIDNDVVEKANAAGLFIDETFTAYSEAIENRLDEESQLNETRYTNVQQELDAVGGTLTGQVFSISRLSSEQQDALASQIEALADYGLYVLGQKEVEISFARSVQQLRNDVSPEGALAQSILDLEAVTNRENQASRAWLQRNERAITDTQNALAQSRLELEAQITQRGDEAETKATANALDLLNARVGYCTIDGQPTGAETPAACSAEGGEWVSAPLAEVLRTVRVTLPGGDTATVSQLAQAFQDKDGQLVARGAMITDNEGRLSGVINTNTGETSQLDMIAALTRIGDVDAEGNFTPLLALNADEGVLDIKARLVLRDGHVVGDLDDIRGQDGADGKDGQDGTDGRDGQDGRDGEDGKDGKDGAPGSNGAPGAGFYSAEYPNIDWGLGYSRFANLTGRNPIPGDIFVQTTPAGDASGRKRVSGGWTAPGIFLHGDFIATGTVAARHLGSESVTTEKLAATALYGKRQLIQSGYSTFAVDPGTVLLPSDLLAWSGATSDYNNGPTPQNGSWWVDSNGRSSTPIWRGYGSGLSPQPITSGTWRNVVTANHQTVRGLCEITGEIGAISEIINNVTSSSVGDGTLEVRVVDSSNNVIYSTTRTVFYTLENMGGGTGVISVSMPAFTFDAIDNNGNLPYYTSKNYRIQARHTVPSFSTSQSVNTDYHVRGTLRSLEIRDN